MRIFITGASGWIGSSVVPELLRAGHEVLALARSDSSAAAIAALGAEVVHGDLEDTERLRRVADDSDGVIHLAYRHDLGQIAGAPADAAAIDAFGTAFAGSDRPLVVTGATPGSPGRIATERDPLRPTGPVAARVLTMQRALDAAEHGVHSVLVMIPRSVHGDGERHGFIPQLVSRARTTGVSGYIGDGSSRWPAVHVADAATLYRLAIERAPAGSVLHAVGDEGVPVREIAEAIARGVGVPAESRPAGEFGMPLAALLGTDMPASSALTRALLAWTPTHPGLIQDIESGTYFQRR